MDQSPTLAQLRAVFACCDDYSGNPHVLWVANNGEVQISAVDGSSESPPITNVRLRYEMFSPQSGHVGQQAAEDTNFMNRIFESLQSQWQDTASGDSEIYVDEF